MITRFLLVNMLIFTMISGCQEKPFVVIIKSNNCTNDTWKKATISSVFGQKYQNMRAIYLYSEDATRKLVEKFIRENHLQNRITLIQDVSLGVALADCKEHESILIRDEDDWLRNENYLAELNAQAFDMNALAVISCENPTDLASLTAKNL